MKETQDHVYINRTRNGDTPSFTFLVDKYKDMAYTIALRVLKNPEDAEDAAQESFVKAYQQLHSFEEKSKFSTWLYTIVYRTAITKKQKKVLLTFSFDNQAENYRFESGEDHVENIEAADRQQFVRKAIGSLPETEGLLITLFYLNENTIREIAEITGLTESNVKVKLFRAKKILEDKLRFLLQN